MTDSIPRFEAVNKNVGSIHVFIQSNTPFTKFILEKIYYYASLSTVLIIDTD